LRRPQTESPTTRRRYRLRPRAGHTAIDCTAAGFIISTKTICLRSRPEERRGGHCFLRIGDTDTTQSSSLWLIIRQILHADSPPGDLPASPEARSPEKPPLSVEIEKQSEATTTAFRPVSAYPSLAWRNRPDGLGPSHPSGRRPAAGPPGTSHREMGVEPTAFLLYFT
jgi:hypothetical protein